MKVEVTSAIGSLDRLLEGNKAGKLPEVGARLAGLLEAHLVRIKGVATLSPLGWGFSKASRWWCK